MSKFFALALMLLALPAFAQSNRDNLRYAEGTLPNISDALFKKNILKTDDPAAVEEYIRIHHCGLYEQYSRDDFAWARLRESQGRELDVRIPSMPEGLEISSTIKIDQYDLSTNQFMLEEKSKMKDVGLITIWDEDRGSMTPCIDFSPFVPRVHPLVLIAKIDTPITLSGIPMPRASADALLETLNARDVAPQDKRKILLVLRMRLTGVDPLSVVTNPMRRTILAELDEVRVYDGPDKKTLLFKKEFESPKASSDKN